MQFSVCLVSFSLSLSFSAVWKLGDHFLSPVFSNKRAQTHTQTLFAGWLRFAIHGKRARALESGRLFILCYSANYRLASHSLSAAAHMARPVSSCAHSRVPSSQYLLNVISVVRVRQGLLMSYVTTKFLLFLLYKSKRPKKCDTKKTGYKHNYHFLLTRASIQI